MSRRKIKKSPKYGNIPVNNAGKKSPNISKLQRSERISPLNSLKKQEFQDQKSSSEYENIPLNNAGRESPNISKLRRSKRISFLNSLKKRELQDQKSSEYGNIPLNNAGRKSPNISKLQRSERISPLNSLKKQEFQDQKSSSEYGNIPLNNAGRESPNVSKLRRSERISFLNSLKKRELQDQKSSEYGNIPLNNVGRKSPNISKLQRSERTSPLNSFRKRELQDQKPSTSKDTSNSSLAAGKMDCVRLHSKRKIPTDVPKGDEISKKLNKQEFKKSKMESGRMRPLTSSKKQELQDDQSSISKVLSENKVQYELKELTSKTPDLIFREVTPDKLFNRTFNDELADCVIIQYPIIPTNPNKPCIRKLYPNTVWSVVLQVGFSNCITNANHQIAHKYHTAESTKPIVIDIQTTNNSITSINFNNDQNSTTNQFNENDINDGQVLEDELLSISKCNDTAIDSNASPESYTVKEKEGNLMNINTTKNENNNCLAEIDTDDSDSTSYNHDKLFKRTLSKEKNIFSAADDVSWKPSPDLEQVTEFLGDPRRDLEPSSSVIKNVSNDFDNKYRNKYKELVFNIEKTQDEIFAQFPWIDTSPFKKRMDIIKINPFI